MKLGKRGIPIVVAAAAATLFAGGSAFGVAQNIVAADNTFSVATYTMDQGDRPTLQNIGFNQHNATASVNGPDGQPLFSSPTIGTGFTTLSGTQYLTTGSYTFICTIHPTTMIATLAVSANGVPVSRPTLALKLLSKKLKKVLKNGLLVRMVVGTKADEMTLEARLGKKLIGKVADISQATGTSFIRVKLNKAGKKKLRKRKTAKISLSGTVPYGAPATSRGKLK